MSDNVVVEKNNESVNLRALNQLWKLSPDGALVRDVIETYLSGAASLEADLLKAANDNDKQGMVRAAHSLKSSSAYVGAERLSSLCLEMVTNLQSGWLVGEEVLARFRKEHQTAAQELREILKKGKEACLVAG